MQHSQVNGHIYNGPITPSPGFITKEIDPLGNETSYTYTKLGNVETITDAANRVRRFEYTRGGKLTAIYFCNKLEQELSYDNAGRVSKRIFADGYEISYSYDALSRIEKVNGTDGREVSYEYDAMGRVTKVSDGDKETLYTYTATGRLKSVVDALSNETVYTYDALDNLKSIHRVDGLADEKESKDYRLPKVGEDGHVTIYSYNLAGQLTEVTDAFGQKEIYEYDQYGRLVTKVDRDNYSTAYSYNDLGRVTRVDYADGKSVALSYDELGRLNEFTDWLGATFIQRDILGRVLSVNDYNKKCVSYNYGKLNERTEIVYPDGRTVDYIYDDERKLRGLVNGNEKTSYDYDAYGRLIEKTLPNGNAQKFDYFTGGMLKSLEMYDSKGLMDRYTYGYDTRGNRTTVNRFRRDLENVSGEYIYGYDLENRLTEVSLDGELIRKYEYDAFGNRSRFIDNDEVTTYSYDNLDRLLETVNDSKAISFEYDKRGNRIAEYENGLLNKTFTFDATNMLSKVEVGATVEATYSYNGMGKRVAVSKPDEQIEFLLDLTKDYHNMLERSVNGKTESYIYDSNVVSMSKSGEDYFYMLDELGTGMYLTGTDGAVASTYAYDEFGRTVNPGNGKHDGIAYTKNGNIIQPLAFTGYQHDEMTGSYFAQARYYNSVEGRFVSEDKIRGYKAKPDSINHYLYCWNRPINYVDCNGKYPTLADSGLIVTTGNYTTFQWVTNGVTGYFEDGYNNYMEEREEVPGISLEEMQEYYSEDLPDYTEEIDAWLEIQKAELDEAFDINYLNGVNVFYNKVKTEGEMDIKQQVRWQEAFQVPFLGEEGYFLYHGVVMNASTLGNVTYAYIGANYFDETALYAGGGVVQVKRHDLFHLPMFYMLPYFGDAPEDHEAIALGIKWHEEGFCDE